MSKTKSHTAMTSTDLAAAGQEILAGIDQLAALAHPEPTALRLFVGAVDGNNNAMLNTWSEGTAELTIEPGQTTRQQLASIRWALELLEAKLTDGGGYFSRNLRLVVGAVSATSERPQRPLDNINGAAQGDGLPECDRCGRPFHPDSSPNLFLCWSCDDAEAGR